MQVKQDSLDEVVLISSGHRALDHRVFDKEAVTLAHYFPRVRVVAEHAADEWRDGVEITALRPSRSRLHRFLLRPLQCYWAARGRGKRLLVLHDAELLVWVPLVKFLTGWRIVYDVHEDYAQLLLRRTWVPPRVRRPMARLVGYIERVFSTACDGIMGATCVLAEHFAPKPRIGLYNLPSLAFIATAAQASRPVAERAFDVLHLGTLSQERLEYLCTVFAEVLRRMPTARALVVGVQPEQVEQLRQRFAPDRVSALSQVDYAAIPDYLGNCRIGVDIHPILYPHLRCAVPVKIFEYMAAGCNVVCSALPELQRVLGEEGAEHVITVYTPSAEAFAEEVYRLLQEPASLLAHQHALMRLVREQWSWEHEAQTLVRFVERICQRKESATRGQVLDH